MFPLRPPPLPPALMDLERLPGPLREVVTGVQQAGGLREYIQQRIEGTPPAAVAGPGSVAAADAAPSDAEVKQDHQVPALRTLASTGQWQQITDCLNMPDRWTPTDADLQFMFDTSDELALRMADKNEEWYRSDAAMAAAELTPARSATSVKIHILCLNLFPVMLWQYHSLKRVTFHCTDLVAFECPAWINQFVLHSCRTSLLQHVLDTSHVQYLELVAPLAVSNQSPRLGASSPKPCAAALRTLVLRDFKDHTATSLLNLIGPLPGLEALTLDNCSFSESMPMLSLYPALMHFALNGFRVHEEYMGLLLQELTTCTSLTSLNLERTEISGTALKLLIPRLSAFTNLQAINLSDNQIHGKKLQKLADSVSTLPHFRELRIADNAIVVEGCQLFATSLPKMTALQVLDVSGCGVGAMGLRYILEALTGLTNLTALYIANNGLGAGVNRERGHNRMTEDTSEFQQAIARGVKIGDIIIDWDGIAAEGAVCLAQHLQYFPNLQELDMSSNCIGDIGMRAIADKLSTLPSLRLLNLASNKSVTPEGLAYLTNQLSFLTALTYLDLGDYPTPPVIGATIYENVVAQGDWAKLHSIKPEFCADIARALRLPESVVDVPSLMALLNRDIPRVEQIPFWAGTKGILMSRRRLKPAEVHFLFDMSNPRTIQLSASRLCAPWYETADAFVHSATLQLDTQHIILSQHRFYSLPGALLHYTQLSRLELDDCQVSTRCSLPTSLVSLSLRNCCADVLDLLQASSRCTSLHIEACDAHTVPSLHSFSSLTSLHLLDLQSHVAFPLLTRAVTHCTSIASLTLVRCGLQRFPRELSFCKHLSAFHCEGNPLSTVPPDVCASPTALFDYVMAGSQLVPCSFAKLVLVGSGFEGKSAVLRALQNAHDPAAFPLAGVPIAERTRGIGNSVWQVASHPAWSQFCSHLTPELPPAEFPPLTYVVYDLAGQSTYFATHQHFLAVHDVSAESARSLFVIVVNLTVWTRKQQRRVIPWLEFISNANPGATVVLVGTHLDCIGVQGLDAAAHSHPVGSPTTGPVPTAQDRMELLVKCCEAWSISHRDQVNLALQTLEAQVQSGVAYDYVSLQRKLTTLQFMRDNPVVLRAAAAVDAMNGTCIVSNMSTAPLSARSLTWQAGSVQLLVDAIVKATTGLEHMRRMIPARWSLFMQAAVPRALGAPSELQAQMGAVCVSMESIAKSPEWSRILGADMSALRSICEYSQALGILSLVECSGKPFVGLKPQWLVNQISQVVFHVRHRLSARVQPVFRQMKPKHGEVTCYNRHPLQVVATHPTLGSQVLCTVTRSIWDANCVVEHQRLLGKPLDIAAPPFTANEKALGQFAQQLLDSPALNAKDKLLLRFLGLGIGYGANVLRAGVAVGGAPLLPVEALVMAHPINVNAMEFMRTGVLDRELLLKLWAEQSPIAVQFLINACTALGVLCPLEDSKFLVPGMIPWPSKADAPLTTCGWWPSMLSPPLQTGDTAPTCLRRRFVLRQAPLFLIPCLLVALLHRKLCSFDHKRLRRTAALLHTGAEHVLVLLRSATSPPRDGDVFAPPALEESESTHSLWTQAVSLDIIAWQAVAAAEQPAWSLFRAVVANVHRLLAVYWPGQLASADDMERVPRVGNVVTSLPSKLPLLTVEACRETDPELLAQGDVLFGYRFGILAPAKDAFRGPCQRAFEAVDQSNPHKPILLWLMSAAMVKQELAYRMLDTAAHVFVPAVGHGTANDHSQFEAFLALALPSHVVARVLPSGTVDPLLQQSVIDAAVRYSQWLRDSDCVDAFDLMGNLVLLNGDWRVLSARGVAQSLAANQGSHHTMWKLGWFSLQALRHEPLDVHCTLDRLVAAMAHVDSSTKWHRMLHILVIPCLKLTASPTTFQQDDAMVCHVRDACTACTCSAQHEALVGDRQHAFTTAQGAAHMHVLGSVMLALLEHVPHVSFHATHVCVCNDDNELVIVSQANEATFTVKAATIDGAKHCDWVLFRTAVIIVRRLLSRVLLEPFMESGHTVTRSFFEMDLLAERILLHKLHAVFGRSGWFAAGDWLHHRSVLVRKLSDASELDVRSIDPRCLRFVPLSTLQSQWLLVEGWQSPFERPLGIDQQLAAIKFAIELMMWLHASGYVLRVPIAQCLVCDADVTQLRLLDAAQVVGVEHALHELGVAAGSPEFPSAVQVLWAHDKLRLAQLIIGLLEKRATTDSTAELLLANPLMAPNKWLVEGIVCPIERSGGCVDLAGLYDVFVSQFEHGAARLSLQLNQRMVDQVAMLVSLATQQQEQLVQVADSARSMVRLLETIQGHAATEVQALEAQLENPEDTYEELADPLLSEYAQFFEMQWQGCVSAARVIMAGGAIPGNANWKLVSANAIKIVSKQLAFLPFADAAGSLLSAGFRFFGEGEERGKAERLCAFAHSVDAEGTFVKQLAAQCARMHSQTLQLRAEGRSSVAKDMATRVRQLAGHALRTPIQSLASTHCTLVIHVASSADFAYVGVPSEEVASRLAHASVSSTPTTRGAAISAAAGLAGDMVARVMEGDLDIDQIVADAADHAHAVAQQVVDAVECKDPAELAAHVVNSLERALNASTYESDDDDEQRNHMAAPTMEEALYAGEAKYLEYGQNGPKWSARSVRIVPGLLYLKVPEATAWPLPFTLSEDTQVRATESWKSTLPPRKRYILVVTAEASQLQLSWKSAEERSKCLAEIHAAAAAK